MDLDAVELPKGLDDALTLQLSGSTGATYVLESKSDLGSPDAWLPVATNVFDPTGLCL